MQRALLFASLLVWPSLARGQAPEDLRVVISRTHPDVRWVTTAELATWMASERPLVILDARTAAEVRVSGLRGALRIDPDHPDVRSIEAPPGARIVVYCSVGWRSASVAQALSRAGRREVFNLQGGIFAWANEGRAVFRGEREVRRVHPYDATWGRMLRRELHAYEAR